MTDTILTRKFGEPLPVFNSIEAASDAIIKAVFRLYVVMNPDKSAENFTSEILVPIAQSSPENPAQIEVRAFNSHSERSFLIYMDAICRACAYVQAARDAHVGSRGSDGWSHIANAQYLLGFAEGIFALEPALASVISARSKSGSAKRDAKFEPLRMLARELASSKPDGKPYPSKRNAALSIKDKVLARAHDLGIELSANQAERTIGGWLDGMSFGSKR
ncbi:hypothetical protein [Paraburkholderia tropica]|uniref:hypothetical protein n=1 Tax=Paraburkholderia tropica TaxID=92647 RepID=UPI003D2B1215